MYFGIIETPPYLCGDELDEVHWNGLVSTVHYVDKFMPAFTVPLEEGIKLQKKLDKANAEYQKTVNDAYLKLRKTVEEIQSRGVCL